MRISVAAALLCLSTAGLAAAPEATAAVRRTTNIQPQSLDAALQLLAKDRDWQMIYSYAVVGDRQTSGVQGELTFEEALAAMLSGTGLTFRYIDEKTVTIVAAGSADAQSSPAGRSEAAVQPVRHRFALAQAESSDSAVPALPVKPLERESLEVLRVGVPEVIVTAGKSLNMDIRRTVDDAQPYVIFGREEIERSGKTSIEDFLRARLPMSAQSVSASTRNNESSLGNQIDLRGLGSGQTLILVDGHRMAATVGGPGAGFSQPSLQGIPLSAIERIEVLPTTASGIYGGSATGGVINVIMRRDYSGGEVSGTYDSTVDGADSKHRLEFSSAFTVPRASTSVLISGSFSDGTPLKQGARDFVLQGREAILENDSTYYYSAAALPPLSYTVNIRNNNGAQNLTLDDGTELSSPWTHVPVGYAGPASDDSQALRDNAGRYNLIPADSPSFSGNRSSLTSVPRIAALNTTLRQNLTSRSSAFLDLGYTRHVATFLSGASDVAFTLPGSAPSNPFIQDIRVNVPLVGTPEITASYESESVRAVGGVIMQLARDWQGELDYTWQRWTRAPFSSTGSINPGPLRTAAIDGTLNILRDPNLYPVDATPYTLPVTDYSSSKSQMSDTSLRLAGPIVRLPAGPIRLSTLLEYRRETLDERVSFQGTATASREVFTPDLSQTVKSAYAEFGVPVFKQLGLQLAARHDAYTLDGANASIVITNGVQTTPVSRVVSETTSTDYTIGLKYTPFKSLALRASYGTGFVPPSVLLLLSNPRNPTQSVNGLVDPRRGGLPMSGTVANTGGGNPNLRPELSESWSAGFVFTPEFLQGFRLSVDFTRISKRDNIGGISLQQLLNYEALFPDRVVRAASCPGDSFSPVCPVIEVNTTAINIAATRVTAYDLQLTYDLPWERFGRFTVFGIGTYQPHLQQQLSPDAPLLETAGIDGVLSAPVKVRANMGVTWTRNSLAAGLSASHFSAYFVADPSVASNATTLLRQGNNGRVPAQTYFDAFVSWEPAVRDWLDGTKFQLTVQNLLNESPPLHADSNQFYSSLADPRLMSYALSITKSF